MAFGSLLRRDSDPWFRELMDIRKTFDELFGRAFSRPSEGWLTEGTWAPPVESYVEKGTLHVRMPMPDIDPKDVTVEVRGNQLRVAGEARQQKEAPERNYLTREFSYQGFERVVTLPEGVKTDALTANYTKGMIEITAPVAEKAMPRKIEIKTGEASKQIAA